MRIHTKTIAITTVTLLLLLVIAILFLLISRFWPGYKLTDGKWKYVTWDEGNGRVEHDIEGINGSLTVLSDSEYAKDQIHVFYHAEMIQGADPATFELLPGARYAKDKSHVFVMRRIIDGADPKTFEIIKESYGRDATAIFCGNIRMNVADPAKFEPLRCTGMWTGSYVKGDFLFHYGEEFEALDVSQDHPAIIGEGWGRDGKYYYYGPARIEAADYATFKIIDGFNSADKNRAYMFSFPADELEERRKKYIGID